MSFDLFFCRSAQSAPTKAAVVELLTGRPLLQVFERGDTVSAHYRRPSTGVFFTLSFDPGHALELTNAPGVFRTGFRATLRTGGGGVPSYTGREAIPVVVDLASAAGLEIEDPQQERASADLSAEGLERSFRKVNDWATDVFGKMGVDVGPYVPRAEADAFWTWTTQLREPLQVELGDGAFAPAVLLLKDADGKRLRTAASWVVGTAAVLPPCERLVINQGKKNPRTIARADLVAALGSSVAPVSRGGLELLWLDADGARLAAARLGDLPFESGRPVIVEPGQFHDLPPAG